jgi:archaeosine-15-forming tRNA-guanine transglycosylase
MEKVTTSNLTLGSLLVLFGGKVTGTTKNDDGYLHLTIEGDNLQKIVDEYKACTLKVNIKEYETANREVRRYFQNNWRHASA